MMNHERRAFEDAFNLFCGSMLGHGIHRKVFECSVRDDLVVKVEDNDGGAYRRFANVLEIEFWHQFQDYDKVAKWLAPCHILSPDGRILLQKRVEPIPRDYQLPSKIPTFLTDLKRSNFGLYEGRLVCVDYANTIANPNTTLKNANWYED